LRLLIWMLVSADKRSGGVCASQNGIHHRGTEVTESRRRNNWRTTNLGRSRFAPNEPIFSVASVLSVVKSSFLSRCSLLPISEAGECGRRDRLSGGCAGAGLRLLIWVLASADNRSGGVCASQNGIHHRGTEVTENGRTGKCGSTNQGGSQPASAGAFFSVVSVLSVVKSSFLSRCSLPPITEAGECARRDRLSEGCAGAGLRLLIWMLVSADKRSGGVCAARSIVGRLRPGPWAGPVIGASSSHVKLPVTDTGECARAKMEFTTEAQRSRRTGGQVNVDQQTREDLNPLQPEHFSLWSLCSLW
jgi:hypothetical protein